MVLLQQPQPSLTNLLLLDKRELEKEIAAFTRYGFDPYFTAHKFNITFADRKPKASAFIVVTVAYFGLPEPLENNFLVLC